MESKRAFDQSRAPASTPIAEAFAAQRAAQTRRAAPPAAYGAGGPAPPFFQRGPQGPRGAAVDPFSLGKTTYRGIPLGAVQAQAEAQARGPLQHASQRPVYRSLAPGTYDANTPVYRSVGLGRPMMPTDGYGSPQLAKSMDAHAARKGAMHSPTIVDPFSRVPAADPFSSKLKAQAPAGPEVAVPDFASAPISPDGIVPPEMPGPPFYLERAHFYSKQPAHELIKRIEDSFKSSEQVDFTFDAAKCKWKIDCYVNNHQLRIIGHVYAVSPQNMLVVEFNRRKGEAFAFCGWYRELNRQLVTQSMVCDRSGSDTPLDMAFSRACRSTPVPLVRTDCLRPLLEMASTGFAETQAEAAREVANLSNNEANRPQIVAAGFLQPLVKLLGSADGNVHRCAAVAVANLAESAEPQVVEQLRSERFAPLCLDALCQMLHDEAHALGGACRCDMESKRASARALANLVAMGSCRLEQTQRDMLHRVHKCCRDARLRAHCGRALSSLSAMPAVGVA